MRTKDVAGQGDAVPSDGKVVDVGGPVFYREWDGPRDLTVVCVHGMGGSHRDWEGVAAMLASRGRVIALDLPGFGRSPRRGRRMTLSGAQAVLSGFLAMVADAPVVLIGTSFGGGIASLQTARETASVRGLILSSSYLPAFYGGWRAPIVGVAMTTEQVGGMARGLRQSLLSSAVVRPADCADDESHEGRNDPAVRVSARDRRVAGVEAVTSLVGLSVRPWLAWRIYDQIHCPVLVLHGEEDQEVPVTWAYLAKRRHPDWELRVHAGVPHVVKLANPEWWIRDVERWLDRLPPPA
jgi:pimeloyl-ACP methyl ester carboxylesterase